MSILLKSEKEIEKKYPLETFFAMIFTPKTKLGW